jgi:hypothetical protein
VRLLLEKGVDSKVEDESGKTPGCCWRLGGAVALLLINII